tara:strand:- start:2673 stop:3152 length:480 start_codon:yes stop_codon:yes gene_type:complete
MDGHWCENGTPCQLLRLEHRGVFENVITIVSPINKLKNSKSRIDYNEQMERGLKNEQLMWDDAKGNPTKLVGGAFGFVHNGKFVDIHKITKICGADERLESWSKNVGQTDRNVLMLSERIMRLPWNKWIELGCPSKIQGTSKVVSAHENLFRYLDVKLR